MSLLVQASPTPKVVTKGLNHGMWPPSLWNQILISILTAPIPWGHHTNKLLLLTFSTSWRELILDCIFSINLPTLKEFNSITGDRSEIPTQKVAKYHIHRHFVAKHIPPPDPKAQVLLLPGPGCEILQVHKIKDQHNGLSNASYAEHFDHGYVIIEEAQLSTPMRQVSSILMFSRTVSILFLHPVRTISLWRRYPLLILKGLAVSMVCNAYCLLLSQLDTLNMTHWEVQSSNAQKTTTTFLPLLRTSCVLR